MEPVESNKKVVSSTISQAGEFRDNGSYTSNINTNDTTVVSQKNRNSKMTLAEFKIWFDGVIFAIGDRPSKEQWAQIVEKLKSVDETVD